jgi:hypothetical protein
VQRRCLVLFGPVGRVFSPKLGGQLPPAQPGLGLFSLCTDAERERGLRYELSRSLMHNKRTPQWASRWTLEPPFGNAPNELKKSFVLIHFSRNSFVYIQKVHRKFLCVYSPHLTPGIPLCIFKKCAKCGTEGATRVLSPLGGAAWLRTPGWFLWKVKLWDLWRAPRGSVRTYYKSFQHVLV